jgi:hypothetical protein
VFRRIFDEQRNHGLGGKRNCLKDKIRPSFHVFLSSLLALRFVSIHEGLFRDLAAACRDPLMRDRSLAKAR